MCIFFDWTLLLTILARFGQTFRDKILVMIHLRHQIYVGWWLDAHVCSLGRVRGAMLGVLYVVLLDNL